MLGVVADGSGEWLFPDQPRYTYQNMVCGNIPRRNTHLSIRLARKDSDNNQLPYDTTNPKLITETILTETLN